MCIPHFVLHGCCHIFASSYSIQMKPQCKAIFKSQHSSPIWAAATTLKLPMYGCNNNRFSTTNANQSPILCSPHIRHLESFGRVYRCVDSKSLLNCSISQINSMLNESRKRRGHVCELCMVELFCSFSVWLASAFLMGKFPSISAFGVHKICLHPLKLGVLKSTKTLRRLAQKATEKLIRSIRHLISRLPIDLCAK